jgi:hypothetical protein
MKKALPRAFFALKMKRPKPSVWSQGALGQGWPILSQLCIGHATISMRVELFRD